MDLHLEWLFSGVCVEIARTWLCLAVVFFDALTSFVHTSSEGACVVFEVVTAVLLWTLFPLSGVRQWWLFTSSREQGQGQLKVGHLSTCHTSRDIHVTASLSHPKNSGDTRTTYRVPCHDEEQNYA